MILNIWFEGENRWYYQLAIMDVFSRLTLTRIFQKNIRQTDVISMIRWLEQNYGLKGTTSVQKWAQSMSCLTDGPPSASASEILSTPADAIRNHQAISRSLPAPTKLDWRATFAYQVNMNTAFKSETS